MLQMHLLWLSSVCGAGRFNRGHRYKSLQALVASLSSAVFLEMCNPGLVWSPFNESLPHRPDFYCCPNIGCQEANTE